MQFSKISFALGFMALGASAALLCSNWDNLSNRVLAMLHKPHFLRPLKIEAMMVPVTITGEVVDSWCYASQTMGPGKGPSHLSCAAACILGGVTPGILEQNTGELFVAAKYTGYKGCNELLAPYIGQIVTVKGYMGYKGNTRVLKISTVEPAVKEGSKTNKVSVSPLNAKPTPAKPDLMPTTTSTNSPKSSTEVGRPVASADGQDDCPECNDAMAADIHAGTKRAK